ncbi:hypothetical protein GBF38_019159 [Nibea albiflora]|uniref:Uncharacterized protein n=1 Tax=Nibea albiflora TaxID=240163 RepID=A0ACB7F2I0_NIBAL|nr:hypothetical protein GBF38_019159 [Nibea albiflora]
MVGGQRGDGGNEADDESPRRTKTNKVRQLSNQMETKQSLQRRVDVMMWKLQLRGWLIHLELMSCCLQVALTEALRGVSCSSLVDYDDTETLRRLYSGESVMKRRSVVSEQPARLEMFVDLNTVSIQGEEVEDSRLDRRCTGGDSRLRS